MLEPVLALKRFGVPNAKAWYFFSGLALGPYAVLACAVSLRLEFESCTSFLGAVPCQGLITMAHTLLVAGGLHDLVCH